jgi:hypothetical protein
VFDFAEGFAPPSVPRHSFSFSFAGDHAPVEPMPFSVSMSQTRTSMENGNGVFEAHHPQPPESSQLGRLTSQESSNVSSWDGYDEQIDHYNKLNKGDVGYGGSTFFAGLINGNPIVAESLLSQRLRSLGVQTRASREFEGSETPPEG